MVKCLIVDDEPLAIEIIQSYLSKIERFKVVATCKSAIQAIDVLHKNTIDLIFLDIQMPKLTGLEFLKTLSNPPKVILVTAYREYAIEGFELDVVDYLVKPVSFERFMKSLNKYHKCSSEEITIVNNSVSKSIIEPYILLRSNRMMLKITLSDIEYIESVKDYIHIHTVSSTEVVKQQISVLEGRLPEELFVRIHRSFIVALSQITSFNASDVYLKKKCLPIGRTYKNAVFQSLQYKGDLH